MRPKLLSITSFIMYDGTQRISLSIENDEGMILDATLIAKKEKPIDVVIDRKFDISKVVEYGPEGENTNTPYSARNEKIGEIHYSPYRPYYYGSWCKSELYPRCGNSVGMVVEILNRESTQWALYKITAKLSSPTTKKESVIKLPKVEAYLKNKENEN